MSFFDRNFELARHGESANVRPMEGLRGFAVILVFLVHYATMMTPWVNEDSALAIVWDLIHTIGNAGVDLFFVLSGYLIYGSLIAREQAFLPFIRRRIARIYPAFCVVFALYLVLSFLRPAESRLPHDVLASLEYIAQNFLLLPGIFKIDPIINVAWSLSYEMLYYLALPVLIMAVQLRSKSPSWRVGFFVAAGAAMALYFLCYGGHVRLILFVAGILLCEAMRSKRIVRLRGSVVVALVAAVLLATAAPVSGHAAGVAKAIGLCAGFFVLCYACFTRPQSRLAQAFCSTPLRWMGNMSYSYYLTHGLALKALALVLVMLVPVDRHDMLFTVAALPPIFLITVLPATALFLFVERPFSLGKTAGPFRARAPSGDEAGLAIAR